MGFCKTGSVVSSQAFACARLLGGTHDIQILGQVGTDAQSTVLLDLLAEKNIDVANVIKSDEPWADCYTNA